MMMKVVPGFGRPDIRMIFLVLSATYNIDFLRQRMLLVMCVC